MPTFVLYSAPFLAFITALAALFRWLHRMSEKQNERLKATLLGVQWLMNKASDKPDTYLSDRVRDALKE